MNSNVVSLRAGPPDPLVGLHAERERLGQELARLGVVDARLAEAERRLAEVEQGLAALDRADRDSVTTWAANGGEGPTPEPLLAERRALLARRLDLQAETDAARVAVNAVAGRQLSLIHEWNLLGGRIRERQVAAALDQARAVYGEVEKLATEIGEKMMRLEGLRTALVEARAEASGRRDDGQAAIFNAALVEVENNFRAPQVLGDPATVARFTAEWKGAMR